jgi:hypothetical protein
MVFTPVISGASGKGEGGAVSGGQCGFLWFPVTSGFQNGPDTSEAGDGAMGSYPVTLIENLYHVRGKPYIDFIFDVFIGYAIIHLADVDMII